MMEKLNYSVLRADEITNTSGIYLVGGFVRDLLLGETPKDIDYVVVGMTKDEFQTRFPEVRPKSVGKKFPVFVGPENEDFAFARLEHSTGPRHQDFECCFSKDVTLADDLSRRDFTINALALCPETDVIIGTQSSHDDLQKKILRHLTRSFTEDPLRVFRLARFAAKLPDFSIAPETLRAASKMADELPYLTAESVWLETLKALHSPDPARYFQVLSDVNALSFWFPELEQLTGIPAGPEQYHGTETAFEHSLEVLRRVARSTLAASTRFAAVVHDLGKGLTPSDELPRHVGHDRAGEQLVDQLCDRLKAPTSFRRAGKLSATQHMRASRVQEMRVGKRFDMLMNLQRFPGGLAEFAEVIRADAPDVALTYFNEFEAFVHTKLRDIHLPEDKRNLGAASGEYLRQMRLAAYRSFHSSDVCCEAKKAGLCS